MLAYLIAHFTPCPPCPPQAQCEACSPEYELYCDLPPGVTGEGQSAWVTVGWFAPAPMRDDLAAIRPGWRVLLCGAFEPVSEPGADRVFRLMGLQIQSR